MTEHMQLSKGLDADKIIFKVLNATKTCLFA